MSDPTGSFSPAFDALLRELQRATQRSEVLAESFRLFAERSADLDQLANFIARRIAEITGDACIVVRISADDKWLRPTAVYHTDETFRAALEELAQPLPRAASGI